jgi:hypothetical protein
VYFDAVSLYPSKMKRLYCSEDRVFGGDLKNHDEITGPDIRVCQNGGNFQRCHWMMIWLLSKTRVIKFVDSNSKGVLRPSRDTGDC